MIIAEQKPLEEIRRMITPYERVLILGCGTCMTVCNAGGERETSFIRNALELAQSRNKDENHIFSEETVKRQCDTEFLQSLVRVVRRRLGGGVVVGPLIGDEEALLV